jgi:hypothetical protein
LLLINPEDGNVAARLHWRIRKEPAAVVEGGGDACKLNCRCWMVKIVISLRNSRKAVNRDL